MKKLAISEDNGSMHLTQDKIDDLREDLLTVLECHMDSIESSELIYEMMKYMTIALYAIA